MFRRQDRAKNLSLLFSRMRKRRRWVVDDGLDISFSRDFVAKSEKFFFFLPQRKNRRKKSINFLWNANVWWISSSFLSCGAFFLPLIDFRLQLLRLRACKKSWSARRRLKFKKISRFQKPSWHESSSYWTVVFLSTRDAIYSHFPKNLFIGNNFLPSSAPSGRSQIISQKATCLELKTVFLCRKIGARDDPLSTLTRLSSFVDPYLQYKMSSSF